MAKKLAKIVKKITYNFMEEEHTIDSFQRENYTIFVEIDKAKQ